MTSLLGQPATALQPGQPVGNWQGNSSPAFLSAVTPLLLVTAAALDVNRISFAGLNFDGSECSVIGFSTWLGLQVRHFLAAR